MSLSLVMTLAVAFQAGDKAGEEQPGLPADLEVPSAPALSPEDELATFAVGEMGVSVELVAAEPFVRDPIAIAFDAQGRMWVVEMRGFMPDVDGTGEAEPNGSIAILVDTDGDGHIDSRTVFLDGLVLPRSVAPCRDGALVIAPPDLLFCRDTDGDGYADERTVLETGLGGIHSPEHATNGFWFTVDGWWRPANRAVEWRFAGDLWESRPTAGGGQWGITGDDAGRVFFNTNSDPLRGDLFPSHYAVRNPNHGRAAGVNVRFAHDMVTRPSRITPGVNRGYRPETLRDDYTLARFTAACGPLIYRGAALESLTGDAFVCEPAGNLIKRYRLRPATDGLGLAASDAYTKGEILTSTDERFRPVSLAGGPDGCLYVVDMYRGVIQHKIFVTSFLRNQIVERELEEPIGLGRIWRLRPTREVATPKVELADAPWSELVDSLGHASGWWRDTARRLLVEEGAGDADALELLAMAAFDGSNQRRRVGAIEVLAAIDGWYPEELERLLDRRPIPEPVAIAAARASEGWLATGREGLAARVAALANGAPRAVRHQVLLSLGEARTRDADAVLLALAAENVVKAEERSAVISGLFERELEALEVICDDVRWSAEHEGRTTFVELLARCVMRDRRAERVDGLLGLVSSADEEWQRLAILDGILRAREKGPTGKLAPIKLAAKPKRLSALTRLNFEPVAGRAREVVDNLAWPGKAGMPPETTPRALTVSERALFDRGAEVYYNTCAQCHQSTGLGEAGKAPALRGSEYVLGDAGRLARIVIHGLAGPIEVDGKTWNMEMPALDADDEDIAAVLTYVRREWGNGAEPVDLDLVEEVHEEVGVRMKPWTVEELEPAD